MMRLRVRSRSWLYVWMFVALGSLFVGWEHPWFKALIEVSWGYAAFMAVTFKPKEVDDGQA